MTATKKPKPRKELKRMSDKRLAQLGGKAYRTIQPNRDAPPKRNPSSSRSSGTRTGMMRRKSRPAAETERIYGPDVYREWLHQQPCAVCGSRMNIQQAHAKTGGMGKKDDWTRTLPLCGPHSRVTGVADLGNVIRANYEMYEGCHAASGARRTFEAKHNITLLALATRTQSKWAAARSQGGDSR